MYILVTGGAGFIGSHFVKYLLKTYKNYHVINLDKLTYSGNLNNLKEIAPHSRYEFVRGDICDVKLVANVMKKCSMVVHFAAETHVDRSIKDGADFVKTNVLGTHVLLQAALLAGVKRFVHVSTDEVYGSRKRGYFKEIDPLNPTSPYSASKASSDLLALSYFLTYKMDVVVTRCSNNFGPNQYPEKILPLFITNLLEGRKVPLYGSGKNVRDWIYVEDHCRAVDLVLHKGRAGEIYNISGENYLNNLSLTKIVLKVMGHSLKTIEYVPDRLGHDFRYAINSSKLRKLGIGPQVPFEEGLASTIKWYADNSSWWKRLKSREGARAK